MSIYYYIHYRSTIQKAPFFSLLFVNFFINCILISFHCGIKDFPSRSREDMLVSFIPTIIK